MSEIAGLDIELEHCAIANDNNLVQLIPKNAAMCTVNGCLIMEPTKLTQGEIYEIYSIRPNSNFYFIKTLLTKDWDMYVK